MQSQRDSPVQISDTAWGNYPVLQLST